MKEAYIIALDQGTTSSRAVIYNRKAEKVAAAQREFRQIFPSSGWVEHDATEIWESQYTTLLQAMEESGISPDQVTAIGITNQRETTILWDRETGLPIHHAIVWQDRRTATYCDHLHDQGHADLIRDKTGLVLDAYFSATKIKYILDHVGGARELAQKGNLAFGTVDSWLVYKLSGGKSHITDVSNASRTMLYNIHTLEWDTSLLDLFDIPASILPEVVDSSGLLSTIDASILPGDIPIAGIAGDQQAALFGQLCLDKGMGKNTYGTGCFMIVNTGSEVVQSSNKLISTIAWKIGDNIQYGLEGSVFVAGSAIQWLRDGLGIIERASDTSDMARAIDGTDGVYFVPALTGLAAPHWDPYARGTIVGINRGTTRHHIVRATLDGIAYQVKDVVDAMTADLGTPMVELRVDGGGSYNSYLMQTQADVLDCDIIVCDEMETTALGAAYLAGLATGYWASIDALKDLHKTAKTYQPAINREHLIEQYRRWQQAIQRALAWHIDTA